MTSPYYTALLLLLIFSNDFSRSAGQSLGLTNYAPSTDFWYMILSQASGKALDIRSTHISQIYPFRYLESQIFRFHNITTVGTKTIYRIIDHEKDQALAVKEDLANIGLEAPNYAESPVNQQWSLRIDFSGTTQIVSEANPNSCMDVWYNEKNDGTNITLKHCNLDPNQKWLLVKLCN